MNKEIIKWDIYEIRTEGTPINGVMLRGRIRKFCLERDRNILAENTEDIDNSVRFGIPTGEDASEIIEYLNKILPDVIVELVLNDIGNPILSKLKVNKEERYEI
jgi:hypothetical protein